MIPAGLHKPDRVVYEMRHHLSQEIRRGDEVRIEDRHELTLGRGQSVRQRARLKPAAIAAMDQFEVHAACPLQLHARASQRRGAIGRIVQHLNLQAIARPVQVCGRVDDALDDARLVVQRELHRDNRGLDEIDRARAVVPVAPVLHDQQQHVHAVNRQIRRGERVEHNQQHMSPLFPDMINKTATASRGPGRVKVIISG